MYQGLYFFCKWTGKTKEWTEVLCRVYTEDTDGVEYNHIDLKMSDKPTNLPGKYRRPKCSTLRKNAPKVVFRRPPSEYSQDWDMCHFTGSCSHF